MVKDAVSPSVLANHLLSVFVKLHLLPLGTKKQVPSENFEGIEGFYHGMSKGGIAGPAHC